MILSKTKKTLLAGLLAVSSVNAQNCDFQSDYSVPSNWTQVGTNVEVSNGALRFINGAADGEQRRVHTNLGTTLNANDTWTAEFKFTPYSIGTYTGHVLFALTETTEEYFNDCAGDIACTGLPAGTQNAITVVYSGKDGSQGFSIRTKFLGGATYLNSSTLPATTMNIPYYITLARSGANNLQLDVYTDAAKTILVGTRNLSSADIGTIDGLTTVQSGAAARGSSSRLLNGEVDDLCINYDVECANFYDYAPGTSSIWTQVGTNVQVNNGVVEFINNAADGEQRRVHTGLGTTLDANEPWTAEFEFTPFSIGTYTGHVLFALTENSEEYFNTCNGDIACTGLPDGSQNAITVVYSGKDGSQGFSIRTKFMGGTTYLNSSTLPATSLNTTYYVTLERSAANDLHLNVYTDAARTVLLGTRNLSSADIGTIGGLTTLQHGAAARGSTSRWLNGEVDNVCIKHQSPIVKSNIPADASVATQVVSGQSINVFPNPSNNGLFTVELDVPANAQVQVYSITGELVLTKTVGKTSFVLDLEDQPAGVYLLKMVSGTETIVKRMVRN